MRQAKVATLLVLMAIAGGCSIGAPSTFTLNSASVDQSYVCPTSASDLRYIIHATIAARNGTSSALTIQSVAVVMTLVAVKGGWLEHIGDKYDASGVTVSPKTVGAGSTIYLNVTIPSACTNGRTTSNSGDASYGDYSVMFTLATSSGTYTIQSQNRHRLIAT